MDLIAIHLVFCAREGVTIPLAPHMCERRVVAHTWRALATGPEAVMSVAVRRPQRQEVPCDQRLPRSAPPLVSS